MYSVLLVMVTIMYDFYSPNNTLMRTSHLKNKKSDIMAEKIRFYMSFVEPSRCTDLGLSNVP